MGIKFIKPTVEKSEPSKGIEYNVDGTNGVVEKVKPKDAPTANPDVPAAKPPKDVPIPFNFPAAPDTEIKDALKEETKKKRGRPPGSGTQKAASDKKTETSVLLSVDALSRQIKGLHEMANIFFPGSSISESNARLMAEQVREVMEVWGVKVNRKITSLIGLVATVAIVEIPVILNVRHTRLMKQSDLKAQQIAAQQSNQRIEVSEPYREPQQPLLSIVQNNIAEGEPLRV